MTNTNKPITNPETLRKAFGTYLTGVTVVTTLNEQQRPVGFTANSFTSVSLEPPLLLVCPGKDMNLFHEFNRCKHFAVNVLAADQEAISNLFASPEKDRFRNIRWQPDENGCPLLSGVCASFSCRTHQRIDAGDHIILLGQIEQLAFHSGQGLGYSNQGYFNL